MFLISSGLPSLASGPGTYLASEAIQLDSNDVGASGSPQPQAGAPVSGYKVVSDASAAKARTEELYAFRTAMAAAEPQPGAQPAKAAPPVMRLLVYGAIGVALILLIVVAFLSFPNLTNSLSGSKPPALYVDLGNRRFDPAGLSGRLIVRWEGKPSYELYLDPVDQQHTAGFQAVAQNSTNPLVVVVRMLDAAGTVGCQKEIDFPAPAQPGAAPDPTQAFLSKTTAAGDTIRDLAGPDGQIAEITTTGPLPCSMSAYEGIAAWDFAANFPTVAGQEDQLKHEEAKSAEINSRRLHSAAGWRLTPVHFQRLPAPIEGDDVIVGDNPSRGTVETSGGRVFQLGAAGMRNRTAEWQVFPASIHFRCDKNGSCTLTRANSHVTLQARLLK
jgi:hypothetical protein